LAGVDGAVFLRTDRPVTYGHGNFPQLYGRTVLTDVVTNSTSVSVMLTSL